MDIWKGIPEISASWQVASPDRNFGAVDMVDWSERERSQQEVQRELQSKVAGIAGMQVFTFGTPSLPQIPKMF